MFDARYVTGAASFTAPHQYPLGIPHVIVDGEFAVQEGRTTGARPRHPLRLAKGSVG